MLSRKLIVKVVAFAVVAIVVSQVSLSSTMAQGGTGFIDADLHWMRVNSPEQTNEGTWVVTQSGNEFRIAYGSGTNFPQYGVLHLDSSYFRLNYGPTSGWGTSVILLPSFWSGGNYYQSAPVTATWQVVSPNLVLSIRGTIASLNVFIQVSLSPPVDGSITAQVISTVEGSIPLDDRPGEAFKPVMLSSMRISSTQWDTQAAFADCQNFALPASSWIIPPEPPVVAHTFGLLGGTSAWKTNAPTIWIVFAQRMQVAGWVFSSTTPDDDNVGLWAASNSILPSWSYMMVATSATNVHCLFLPMMLRNWY